MALLCVKTNRQTEHFPSSTVLKMHCPKEVKFYDCGCLRVT